MLAFHLATGGDLMQPLTLLVLAIGIAGVAILILFAKDKI